MREDTEWCKDYANVTRLAHWLVETEQIDDLNGLLYFFDKPWKWTTEWNEVQAVTVEGK